MDHLLQTGGHIRQLGGISGDDISDGLGLGGPVLELGSQMKVQSSRLDGHPTFLADNDLELWMMLKHLPECLHGGRGGGDQMVVERSTERWLKAGLRAG